MSSPVVINDNIQPDDVRFGEGSQWKNKGRTRQFRWELRRRRRERATLSFECSMRWAMILWVSTTNIERNIKEQNGNHWTFSLFSLSLSPFLIMMLRARNFTSVVQLPVGWLYILAVRAVRTGCLFFLLLTVHFVRVVFLSFQFRTGFCNIITGQCATQHILFILFLPRPIDKCRNCGVVGEEAKIKKKKQKKEKVRNILCRSRCLHVSVCT
jgi:hypothetical protein